jgi:hypothetical protein
MEEKKFEAKTKLIQGDEEPTGFNFARMPHS